MDVLSILDHFRKAGKYCDATVSVGDRHFPLHRNMLAAYSPVWDLEVLQHSGQGHVNIIFDKNRSSNPEVMSQIIDFMYTGDICITQDNIDFICRMSCSLQILNLANKIKDYFVQELNDSPQNFIPIIKIAMKFKDLRLKEECVSFLQIHLDSVTVQEEFIHMSVIFLDTLLNFFSDLLLPMEVLYLLLSWMTQDLKHRECYMKTLIVRHIKCTEITMEMYREIKHFERIFNFTKFLSLSFLQVLLHQNILLGPLSEDLFTLRQSLTLEEYASVGTGSVDISDVDDNCDSLSTFDPITFHVLGDDAKNSEYSNQETFAAETDTVTECSHQVHTENNSCPSRGLKMKISVPRKRKGNPRKFKKETESVVLTTNNDDSISKTWKELSHPQETEKSALNFQLQGTESCAFDSKQQTDEKSLLNSQLNVTQFSAHDSKQVTNQKSALNFWIPVTECSAFDSFPKTSEDICTGDGHVPAPCIEPTQERQKYTCELEQVKEDVEVNVSEESSGSSLPLKKKRKLPSGNNSGMPVEGPANTVLKSGQPKRKTRQRSCRMKSESLRTEPKVLQQTTGGGYSLTCEFCDYSTSTATAFFKHMQKHFKGPPYKCADCDYSKASIRDLMIHRYKHSSERKFSCPECDQKFKFPTGLSNHMRLHGGEREKNFTCDICNKSFYTKTILDAHKITHGEDRPFLCDMCGFTSKSQSDLSTHKRIHSGKVFRCDLPDCSYSTPRLGSFRQHCNSHLNKRDFQCHTCGKVFIDKKTLTTHEKMHSGNKPFKCTECWYATYRKDKYNEHMKKRHGANPTAKRKMPVPSKMRRELEEQGWIPKSDSGGGCGNLDLAASQISNNVVANFSLPEQTFVTGLESYIQFLQ